jgi:hypothetical protein
MKTLGVEVQLYSLLTSTRDGGDWSTSSCSRYIPGNVSHYPLNRRLCGLHSQSGIFEEADIRTPDLQARMLVTVLTTLTMWFIPKNKAITLGVLVRRSLCVVVTNRSIR